MDKGKVSFYNCVQQFSVFCNEGSSLTPFHFTETTPLGNSSSNSNSSTTENKIRQFK